MKRSVAILLSALLLLTSVPMVSADAYNDDQFDWGDDACPHTQTETVEAVASTCTTQGHGVYTYCVACKLVLEGSRELLPLGDHAYEVETTPADCTNDGLSVYTCSVCFDSYEEVVPANGQHVYLYACDQYCNSCGEKTNPRAKHTVLHVEAKEAVSCIEFGNKEYWCCDSCNTVWLDADLRRQSNMKSVQTAGPCVSDSPACKDGVCVNCGLPCAAEAEHTYDGICDADCNACGDIREVDGHEYVPLSAEPATCDKDGFEKYYCPNCGDHYTVTVPAIGHDYDAVVTTPDCENSGYTVYTCIVCGHSYVDNRVDALGHNYQVTESVEPTCVATGKKVYACANCGDTYTEVIPATGQHTYEYKCDEDCNVCGYIRNDAHSYMYMGMVEPTCGKDGMEGYKCWSCEKFIYVTIPATGKHTYSGACDTDCDVCGDTRESVVAHNYVLTEDVAVTCTTDGKQVYTCQGCGDSYTNKITAQGHTYHIVVTAPTCEQGGYTTHTCTACGDVCVDNRTSALGHSYDDDSDADCNVCGAKREVTVLGDISGDGKVNNRDLGLLQKRLNGADVTIDEIAADMDGNGKINNRDLGMLQKLLNA